MKMKFMQRAQETEKRKQLQEDAQREKSAAEWTKESGTTVYVVMTNPASRRSFPPVLARSSTNVSISNRQNRYNG